MPAQKRSIHDDGDGDNSSASPLPPASAEAEEGEEDGGEQQQEQQPPGNQQQAELPKDEEGKDPSRCCFDLCDLEFGRAHGVDFVVQIRRTRTAAAAEARRMSTSPFLSFVFCFLVCCGFVVGHYLGSHARCVYAGVSTR